MQEALLGILDFVARFTGGHGGIDDEVAVYFVLAGAMWLNLLFFALWRRRNEANSREALLVLGFSAGLARELFMLAMAIGQKALMVDPRHLHAFFPPVEHVLSGVATVIVAAAFMRYLTGNFSLARNYLGIGIVLTLSCYGATFKWWAHYIMANPASKFGQTWCDVLFHTVAALLIVFPTWHLFRHRTGWLRNIICFALACFFLTETLKLVDIACGERYEYIFTPIRRSFNLIGIYVLGYVYIREQEARRRRANAKIAESEKRYRTLVENVNLGISLIDSNNRIVMNNGYLEKMFRKNAEKLTGRFCYREFENRDECCDNCLGVEAMTTGRAVSREVERILADGEPSGLRLSAFPVFNEQGKATKFIKVVEDITDRKRAEEKIRRLAYYDSLTGLPNRPLMMDRLSQAIRHARRHGEVVALLFLDLDRFKDVNDSQGHRVGDRLLQDVAARLAGCTRESDTLARLGGDEFVIIAPGVRAATDASLLADKILGALAEPFMLDRQTLHIATSIGIVLFPSDGGNGEMLLQRADMAMYAAKDRGGNSYRFFSAEMNTRAVERHELEEDMRQALTNGEFFLMYQPQVNTGSWKVVGVEALIRWNHPRKGVILPSRFIPVAEETGFISKLGRWVLEEACRQGAQWQRDGLPPLQIGVNLCARQFTHEEIVGTVNDVLQKTGLPSELLEIELTETMLMDSETAVSTLGQLKALGVRLAIDDFGTGYSSFNYLKHFPLDRIKIDQSFIRDIGQSRSNGAIIEAIIAVARSLGPEVLAEGVETEEQLRYLMSITCADIQGFYFSRPLLPDDVSHLMRESLPGSGTHRYT
ncbi:putative bifunctional diguanylate cyclase/phosphodiesterase [Geobacter grbiciae]|uniref:putative bifunctional diguanylate cyclase/phosphodiesterase n=1 Tax=Geobacter grbiciae TaxID=155042 RepID=UPI001C02F4D7|nr:EAL domain-containing protein [Geobacter grbiciae]MBT1075650.1 EAL domain-containing protein [Geobacter grbiciae]